MKKLYILLFTFLIAAVSFGQEAVITGYVDSPCPSALGRTVEIYVDGTVDFTGWTLDRQANGGGYTYSINLTSFGTLSDEFAYITNDASILSSEFGITTNVITNSGITDNGDDAFQLFDGSNVVDRFGEVGIDGTSTAWEHEDTYYYRVDGTPANAGSFSATQFNFGALNLLDGKGLCNSSSALSTFVPFGTYSTTGSTAPTLYLVDSPASGSTIEVGPEDLNGDLEFGTTNFVVASPSAGDGYITWSIVNVTDGGAVHDSGDIFDTSQIYPFTALETNKTYTLTAELLNNSGDPLPSPVVYTLTANTLGYNVVADIAALRSHVDTNGEGLYYEITGASLVTHTDSYQNRHWVQDSNVSGVLIYDANGNMSTYTVGDNITGLKGQTTISNGLLRFNPSTDSGVVASQGNPVTPQIVTIPDFNTNYTDFESELIELENVTFDLGDGVATFSTGTNYDVSSNAGANIVIMRTDFFTADYIGEFIPSTEIPSLVAVAGSFNSTAQIYARNLSDFTLSSKFNQIDGFGVYPNPTSLDYVTITSKNNAKMSVSVFDMLGKQVLNTAVKNNTLNVSNLTSGIYIIKVAQEDAISTQKLIIQ